MQMNGNKTGREYLLRNQDLIKRD